MAYSLPPTLTDRLSAVNVILSAIGESPVSSIEGDTAEASEAQAAINVLDEMTLAVQSEGWPWNRDYQMVLPVDLTGRIPLPDNCLRITKAYPSSAYSGSVVERGRALYDNILHTPIFSAPVMVDMISKLAFEDMPEAARRYVTIRAAKQYQGRVQINALVDRITDGEVLLALRTLEEERDEAEPINQIYGNAETLYRVQGRDLRRRY